MGTIGWMQCKTCETVRLWKQIHCFGNHSKAKGFASPWTEWVACGLKTSQWVLFCVRDLQGSRAQVWKRLSFRLRKSMLRGDDHAMTESSQFLEIL